MEVKIILIILALPLLIGCVTEKTRTAMVVNYVCPDGSIVSDSGRCGLVEPEEIVIERYVCGDGTVEDNAGECPESEPVLVKVLRYVCLDGSTVNESQKCPPSTAYLVTTTSTVVHWTTTTSKATCTSTTASTTTAATTTSTQPPDSCSALGCPLGTGFVGSVSSDKYHLCDCRYAKKIRLENIVCFSSGGEAEDQGYVSCGVCSP